MKKLAPVADMPAACSGCAIVNGQATSLVPSTPNTSSCLYMTTSGNHLKEVAYPHYPPKRSQDVIRGMLNPDQQFRSDLQNYTAARPANRASQPGRRHASVQSGSQLARRCGVLQILIPLQARVVWPLMICEVGIPCLPPHLEPPRQHSGDWLERLWWVYGGIRGRL